MFVRAFQTLKVKAKETKESLAKFQLKHLPDPLKDYPKKLNKYALFLKDNAKGKSDFSLLAKEWKTNPSIQREYEKKVKEVNTQIEHDQLKYLQGLNAFHYSILNRRKYLSSVAGLSFPSIELPSKKSSGAYLLFVKDYFGKTDYEKDALISGFSTASAKERMSLLGKHWQSLDEDQKMIWKQKASDEASLIAQENSKYQEEHEYDLFYASELIESVKAQAKIRGDPTIALKEKEKMKELKEKEREKQKEMKEREKKMKKDWMKMWKEQEKKEEKMLKEREREEKMELKEQEKMKKQMEKEMKLKAKELNLKAKERVKGSKKAKKE